MSDTTFTTPIATFEADKGTIGTLTIEKAEQLCTFFDSAPIVRVRDAFDSLYSADLPFAKVRVEFPSPARARGEFLDLAVVMALAAYHEGFDLSDTLVLGTVSASRGAGGRTHAVLGVPGVLQMVEAAAREGITRVVVPFANAGEASLVDGVTVYSARTLDQALHACHGLEEPDEGPARSTWGPGVRDVTEDLASICIPETVLDALVATAAGGHDLLFEGPRQASPTLYARRLPDLLPDLDETTVRETTRTYSAAGLLEGPAATRPPLRCPHFTISVAGMLGRPSRGGGFTSPGELSLAHGGVLYLDDLPDFERRVVQRVLAASRQASVTYHRRTDEGELISFSYPARAQIVAAMRACPCGKGEECTCSAGLRERYRDRAAALGERALYVSLGARTLKERTGPNRPDVPALRERVRRARDRAITRQGCLNARLTDEQIEVMDSIREHLRYVQKRNEDLHDPGRSLHTIRQALTFADLDDRDLADKPPSENPWIKTALGYSYV